MDESGVGRRVIRAHAQINRSGQTRTRTHTHTPIHPYTHTPINTYLYEDAVLVEGEELTGGEGVELREEEREGGAVPRELLVLAEGLLACVGPGWID